MKKNFLILSLVGLGLTAASARAATPQNEDRVTVQLPAFRVEASRLTAGERQIERNLAELRAEARTPMTVPVERPTLKLPASAPQCVAESAPAGQRLPVLLLAKN